MVIVAERNVGITTSFTANVIQRHVSQAIIYFLEVKVTFRCLMFNPKLLPHIPFIDYKGFAMLLTQVNKIL